jgi:hypothetical protein
MLATALPRRRLTTLYSVYQPIEEYWETCAPRRETGTDLERVFPPLDAYLIHLLLERFPQPPVLIDLAAEFAGGASTILGLLHPHVQAVVAGWRSTAESSDETLTALSAYHRLHGLSTNLEIRPTANLLAGTLSSQNHVVLVDARAWAVDMLAGAVMTWCDSQIAGILLLLGLGNVGTCPALEAVLRLCPSGGARRFWLARELADALAASTLGIVAPANHGGAADALSRVGQLFASNHQFVQLLRDANHHTLEAAQLDADIMKTHPSAWPLNHELQEWQRQSKAAREEAEQVRRQLSEITQHRDALQHDLESIQQSLAYRLAGRLGGYRNWLAWACRSRLRGRSR